MKSIAPLFGRRRYVATLWWTELSWTRLDVFIPQQLGVRGGSGPPPPPVGRTHTALKAPPDQGLILGMAGEANMH
ncbi:hypothetical protein NDU88_000096 [Pleurodeles waltl]|uniref:Uncharacterized protein n=1 Tax=Pleurodeles waltl TaxID=8319 RepID=A0AAV7NF36_PLEWA|nr:hypothetical protein NDU88_000096 [Pleurodeles waltl]